ncbi:MAG: DUF3052 domain-containing protein [Acidobacteria bacterium]|nr:MAG: DUF3052 domain-containing protein [Acidobacteriota bacterium]
MAGYSGTPLLKKLGVKEGFRITLADPPESFLKELALLPQGATIVSRPSSPVDLIVLFVSSERRLKEKFQPYARKLKANGMIWVAWPKKSSGVATDLAFDNVQKTGLTAGLVDVKICAIDEIWSGLKFVYRLSDRAK